MFLMYLSVSLRLAGRTLDLSGQYKSADEVATRVGSALGGYDGTYQVEASRGTAGPLVAVVYHSTDAEDDAPLDAFYAELESEFAAAAGASAAKQVELEVTPLVAQWGLVRVTAALADYARTAGQPAMEAALRQAAQDEALREAVAARVDEVFA